MSRGIISIGGEDYYRVADEEIPSNHKEINFRLFGANNGDYKMDLGSNNNDTSFQVQDSSGDSVFRVGSGGQISFKTVSKLPISTDIVGRKGDLKLVAKTDNQNDSTSIILHHDTNAPVVTIQALNQRVTTTSSVTASNDVTYTASQIIGGIIERNPSGARRTDTFPTGVDLINSLYGVKIGDILEVMITNLATLTAKGGGDQEYIDLNVGSNAWVASSGQTSLLPGETKVYKLVVTNVGTPAYSIYLLGSSNHKINNWHALWWDQFELTPTNVDITTSTFSDVFLLISDAGATMSPSIPSTPQMFDSSSVSVIVNRGPLCKAKIVGRMFVTSGAIEKINIELAILKNGAVITSSRMGASLEKTVNGGPQIQTMAIVDLSYNDNIKLVLKLISGTSSPTTVTIYHSALIVSQIDN